MSMGTIFGFGLSLILIIGSIIASTSTPSVFINYPSLLIVVGGTVATVFISYEFKTAIKALKLMGVAFKNHKDAASSLKDQVGLMVKWGYTIQKNGLQGLENEITEEFRAENEFLSYGVDLVVTGYTGAEVKQILLQSIEAKEAREKTTIDALKKMGGDAPAFGMLGTLIGLVIMLGNMGADPSSIGPSMAVALITTFYGVFAARLFFIPLATKMAARADVSTFKNYLQVEGLMLLAERKSPRFIQDKINSFVDASEQFSIDDDMKATPKEGE
ncbi:MAG: MotA/TolQ/ExbB proton channel family protein [Alphaproteobacteria bacterium]